MNIFYYIEIHFLYYGSAHLCMYVSIVSDNDTFPLRKIFQITNITVISWLFNLFWSHNVDKQNKGISITLETWVQFILFEISKIAISNTI